MNDDIPELLRLTKREVFAAMLFQGIKAGGAGHGDYRRADYASEAVKDADALIAALARPPSEMAFTNTDTSGGR